MKLKRITRPPTNLYLIRLDDRDIQRAYQDIYSWGFVIETMLLDHIGV